MAKEPQAASAWAFAVGLSNLTFCKLIVHLDFEFFRLAADDLQVRVLPRALRVFRKLSPR
jgi:hypothetical protein